MTSSYQDFGRYRLIGVLGTGGMARVVLAVMTGTGGFSRVVALKQVLPHLAESRQFVSMFLKEAHLAAKLDHPDIVRIYELGQIDGQYFISMEYLPGEDLTRVITRSRKLQKAVPIQTACTIIQSIAEALDFAHELKDASGNQLGLVHRDVSPANIIVTYHGGAKLADFGIAKATTVANEIVTVTGFFKGKLSYASPEQVFEQEIDRRSDVFALGIVLWELLALRRLFKRKTEAGTVHAVGKADVPPLRDIRSDITPALEKVIMKALARKRQERFQTAREMSEALDEVLSKSRSRPMQKDIRGWMTELFGKECADLKLAVAQGRRFESEAGASFTPEQAAVLRLKPLSTLPQSAPTKPSDPADRARNETTQAVTAPADNLPLKRSSSLPTGWLHELPPSPEGAPEAQMSSLGVSADLPSFSSPGSGSVSRSIPLRAADWLKDEKPDGRSAVFAGMALGMAVVAAMGFAVFKMADVDRAAPSNAAAATGGQLAISSEPSLAKVTIAGLPGAYDTPAVIYGLPTDRPLEVRVEKAGVGATAISVQLTPGHRINKSVRLAKVVSVVFKAPLDTILVVDGKTVDTSAAIPLLTGTHQAKLLKAGAVILTRAFSVERPNQTIAVEPGP